MAPTLEKFTSEGEAKFAASIKGGHLVRDDGTVTTNLQAGEKTCGQIGGGGGGSFDQLLNKIQTVFGRSNSSVDVDELWKVLEDYKSNPDEWAKYAFYDMRKYKRNLVAEHDKYNVMIICWGPGSQSCIHDHSGSHCFMKMLDGELIESRFAWPDQNQILGEQGREMCRLSDTLMKQDDVLYINGKFLAQVDELQPLC